MKYLLDANACIFLLAGHPSVVARASQCDEGDLAMSAIAFAEVAIGSWNAKSPSIASFDPLRRIVSVLDFDVGAAQQYAQLPFKRGSFDRLIAAHALSLGLTLVTANERDFAAIPGLVIEDWTR